MNVEKYRTLLPIFEELQGERVVIRPYRESDAQSLVEAVSESRKHIRPWLRFADAHQTVEESRDWIIQQQAKFLLREDMSFNLQDKASGKMIGGTALHTRDWKARYFEIGYWLRVSATGHGYVTEAVKLLTEYAFTHLQANRVEIRCDTRNTHSAAVAQRLGFVQEGHLRNQGVDTFGNLRDLLVFALIPSDKRFV